MPRTAASSTYSTRALVLRTRNLGEKDRILTLFSPDKGRFGAVAKGSRGPKSKLGAAAQPLVLGRWLLAHGKSLEIVSQVEIEAPHGRIAVHLPAAAWAAYVCELCDHLPENVPDADTFELLAVALTFIEVHADDFRSVEEAGWWFEARFLGHQGYAPTLGVCVGCESKISVAREEKTQKLAFSPRLGGNLCPDCLFLDPERMTLGVETLRALHRLGRAPLPVALELSTSQRNELGACLRRALMAHYAVKLRSRAFLDEISAGERLAADSMAAK